LRPYHITSSPAVGPTCSKILAPPLNVSPLPSVGPLCASNFREIGKLQKQHWTKVAMGANMRSKRLGHWQQKSKNGFCAYLRRKWIDLHQTDTIMITISLNTFHQRNAAFLW